MLDFQLLMFRLENNLRKYLHNPKNSRTFAVQLRVNAVLRFSIASPWVVLSDTDGQAVGALQTAL